MICSNSTCVDSLLPYDIAQSMQQRYFSLSLGAYYHFGRTVTVVTICNKIDHIDPWWDPQAAQSSRLEAIPPLLRLHRTNDS